MDAVAILWDFFQRGGLWMWPVLAVFLTGLGFAIERALGLRRMHHIPHDFEKDLLHMVDVRGVDAGLALCVEKHSSLSLVLQSALMRQGGKRSEQEAAVIQKSAMILYSLLRNTRMVGLMSLLAVLLGLLGTCMNAIWRLDGIAGDVSWVEDPPRAMADALMPFAFGLFAAVPLLYFYFRLRAWAGDLVHEIQEKTVGAVLDLDRKARQSIRLIEDIQEQIQTKTMPGVIAAPDLSAEFEEHGREGSGVKTGITTPAHLPAAEDIKRKVT